MELNKKDYDRAYFVGGISGYFRDSSDPRVEKALRKVEKLFDNLPNGLTRPGILSGGLTSDPDTILDFYWGFGASATEPKVTIKIKLTGKFDYYAQGPAISPLSKSHIGLQETLELIQQNNSLAPFVLADAASKGTSYSF